MKTEKKNRKKNGWQNKQIILYPIILVCLILAVIEGSWILRMYFGKFREVAETQQYDKYYVMITEDQKSSFWRAIYEGAYEEGIEQNAYVELLGDTLLEQYTREDLMRIAISSKVDGIMLSADESEELTALIDEAADNGIPVITLYNDATHSKRSSFVGIGSYNLGSNYGKKVLELISTDRQFAEQMEPVKVTILINPNAQDTGQNIFCSGIQETLEKEMDSEISLSLVTVDNASTFSAEESIRDLFMKEDIPDIIICLNEMNTTCVYQAVVDYNKVGQVHILGYYDSEAIVKAIDRNVIDATVSIDTAQMGRFCIEALTEYHEVGNTSQYFTADITMIDKYNVGKYLEEAEDEK